MLLQVFCDHEALLLPGPSLIILGTNPLYSAKYLQEKKMDVNNVQIQNIIAKNQVKVPAVVHVSLYVLYVYLPVCLPVSHPVRYIVGV